MGAEPAPGVYNPVPGYIAGMKSGLGCPGFAALRAGSRWQCIESPTDSLSRKPFVQLMGNQSIGENAPYRNALHQLVNLVEDRLLATWL